ncbi:MAG: cellulose biosynthesis protein BcsS [Micavibrio sp.]|nr:cellulose biosynthesis protein BcsS [Micavibrio sp.]
MTRKILAFPLLGLGLAMCMTASPALAASTDVFVNFGAKNSYYDANIGAVTALQGQDIKTQNGWLLRGDAGYASYDYDITGANIDGNLYSADVLAGYGFQFTGGHANAYFGGGYANQDLDDTDPGTNVKGDRFGAMIAGDATYLVADRVELNGMGSYNTAFGTYDSRFDAGYKLASFTVGPEVGFKGNNAYDQNSYGVALSDIDLGFANTRIAAGYANTNGRAGDSSLYGTLGFERSF